MAHNSSPKSNETSAVTLLGRKLELSLAGIMTWQTFGFGIYFYEVPILGRFAKNTCKKSWWFFTKFHCLLSQFMWNEIFTLKVEHGNFVWIAFYRLVLIWAMLTLFNFPTNISYGMKRISNIRRNVSWRCDIFTWKVSSVMHCLVSHAILFGGWKRIKSQQASGPVTFYRAVAFGKPKIYSFWNRNTW